ncbi:MlaD family protein [Mucisphaera sp.]|uniref:MlaD family protein n=1 Tax=Mucisphaera sp. TaxID=2913024 RepID=UPI003D0DAC53
MSEATNQRDLAVGLTAGAGLIGLVALLMLFGYVPGFFESGYQYRVYVDEAAGLYEDSRVTISGLDVGKVTDVHFRDAFGSGVEAIILISEKLPRGVEAEVKATSLLGGGSVINFTYEPTPDEPTVFLPFDGSEIIDARIASPTDALAGLLDEPMARFDAISDDLTRVLNEWADLGENLNLLVEPRDAADVEAGLSTSNLATVLQRTESSLMEAEQTLAAFRELVDDEVFREDLKQTASNARTLTERAETTIQSLEETVSGTIESLERRLVAVADDLSGTIATASELLSRVNEGGGTVGKMLNDPALYDNLNDAAERLKAVMLEVRLLVEKIQAEGVLSSL